ncbi:LacI family DNA-binding transcriptional regulator [Dactylosporangium darangshiense]|uniref:LacI family DNA-binding transcriptional regulator n=1 Tax=Dactylosporangium darangshiense TaxID=579108 RepID=A0ABP8DHM3_9ACTN
MAVTIKDIARAVGVSTSTVSRALAGSDLLPPGTRRRIEQAADELGYHPNRVARALSTGRTGNVGLLVPDLLNPYFAAVVKGVQARARESGHWVFLTDTDEDAGVEADRVHALVKQVDGVVLCAPRTSESRLRALARETPMVMLNRRVAGIPSVTTANGEGIRQAVAHLVALGHERLAYVAGPRASWSNRDRLCLLRTAMAAAGVDLVETANVEPRFAGGIAAADRILEAGVTAVVAYNDLVALGLLDALGARGVAVPGRISIVGFDDILPAELVSPALTTVGQPSEEVGRAGMDLLLRLMADPRLLPAPALEPVARLVVRGSTGPAPGSRLPHGGPAGETRDLRCNAR